MSAECRLCGGVVRWTCRQRPLDRHDVDYFTCETCALLQTESPHWLVEAYEKALSRLDTGAVQRNETAARLTELVATLVGLAPDAPCLDYGGGHGVFVRMMRDAGLDFRWFDTYAENLFARGFEGDPAQHHGLVTAFEVLEHFANVRTDLDALFAGQPDHVLVGTLLHRGHQPGWWYYLLESGQHVAFYARETLAWIGAHYGYDVIVADEYSLFSKQRVGGLRGKIVRHNLLRPTALASIVPRALLRRLSPYRSRTQADYEWLRGSR